jgi:ATP-binding cassette, subfamily C, bacterial PrsD
MKGGSNPVLDALASCRTSFVGLGIFSGLINVLMLTGSFYMLQVYDRVLLSQSIPTLVMLSVMALAAFGFQGFLDVVRTRIFGRVAERVDLEVGPIVYDKLIRLQGAKPGNQSEAMQPFRDLEALRTFLSGTGPVALFDLPWLPIYLIACFLLHPWLGLFATFSCVLLIVVAVVSEMRSHRPTVIAHEAHAYRNSLVSASVQGAEVINAMGMMPVMRRRWQDYHERTSTLLLSANDVSSGLGSMARTLRMVIQSATLGLGAYLVIRGEMTAGTIIAASIISGRAIAPVDLAVGSYRGFQVARQGYMRLVGLFKMVPDVPANLRLLAPERVLSVDNVVILAPSDGRPIIKGISVDIPAGQALGILGHSASGKSTLGRALVGLWQPARGSVSLDGSSLRHWDPEQLGRHIGYLPHDVQLFEGTIAENIARFDEKADPEDIYKAAKLSGSYELIATMPSGFNTNVGFGGVYLSAGQRQRIGLARALYGDPFLVVLDEPNSNLDAAGEAAVTAAIVAVRKRGGIVIVIAHRPSAITAVDYLMVLKDGAMVVCGHKDDVLKNVTSNAPQTRQAINPQQEQGTLPKGHPANQDDGPATGVGPEVVK